MGINSFICHKDNLNSKNYSSIILIVFYKFVIPQAEGIQNKKIKYFY